LLKALFEAGNQGLEPERALLLVTELRGLLEKIL